MSKALRLSEKWFNRGLWLVALVFAGFLIGLGGALVDDLPKVEQRATLADFMDPVAAPQQRQALQQAQVKTREAQDALKQAQLKHRVAQSDSQVALETFNNWLATRHATARAEQDAELVARSTELDRLKAGERSALAAVQQQQQAVLDAQQATEQAQRSIAQLEEQARAALNQAQRTQELRVFLYRLLLTLPLLAVAGWLFVKQRRSVWWPFVWGFIFFALFAFFVELVPYLPSYGGYVRYAVGILITALVGRYAIQALHRYRERQQQAEALPDAQRREELSYDVALARLAKAVCPGCERPLDLKTPGVDFCAHCGIGLFDHCHQCQARKSAFARFCQACGTPAQRASASDTRTLPAQT